MRLPLNLRLVDFWLAIAGWSSLQSMPDFSSSWSKLVGWSVTGSADPWSRSIGSRSKSISLSTNSRLKTFFTLPPLRCSAIIRRCRIYNLDYVLDYSYVQQCLVGLVFLFIRNMAKLDISFEPVLYEKCNLLHVLCNLLHPYDIDEIIFITYELPIGRFW